MTEENLMYAHSACCGAHWELVCDTDTGEYSLLCENCGEPLVGLEIKGPLVDDCVCDECKRKKVESN